MANRTTVLGNEDTETSEINRKSDADVREGKQGSSNDAGEEHDDLMQDEEDTDGPV